MPPIRRYEPPAVGPEVLASFPAEHVMLLVLNRPKMLNAMTPDMERDIKRLLDWFEAEPGLWVVIVTGAGRAFCAGADLKAWKLSVDDVDARLDLLANSSHGFGSLSRWSVTSKAVKPIIAAVNGICMGGGLELLVDCDLVVASENAVFAYPEVKRGVMAAQGGIPRISRIAGHQLASELLLTGRTISANEARDRFRFVNQVVANDKVMSTALDLARQICENSPDAVQGTKRALVQALDVGSVEEAFAKFARSPEARRTYAGANIKEGLAAFSEKRKVRWTNPAKL